MNYTETDIVRGCIDGNPKFERMLVEQYGPVLMTVCRRYARNWQEAQDVLQDSFVKVFEHLDQFDPERGRLENWMRSIAIRTALRDYRRRFPVWRSLHLLREKDVVFDHDVFARLAEEDLLKVISSLPSGYREVFNLYVIDGYSHGEIGALLGITASSSRSQLTRAKKFLRKKLMDYKYINTCQLTTLATVFEVG